MLCFFLFQCACFCLIKFLIHYYFLDAFLVPKETQKGCEFRWEGTWEKTQRSWGRGNINQNIEKIGCYNTDYILIYSYEIYILFFSRLVTWDICCYFGFLIVSMQKYNGFFTFLTLWINLFLRVVS